MKYISYGICLKNKREYNMDRLLLMEREVEGKHIFLGLVCDGVGSLENGMVAAQSASDMIRSWWSQLDSNRNLGLRLRDYILQVNEMIVSESRMKNIQSASTLSAILIAEEQYYIVHTGDSRIYSFTKGRLERETYDDVTEEGKLSGFIGLKEKINLHYFEGSVGNKLFLICSDGLYKRVGEGEIATQICRLPLIKAVEELAKDAIVLGETDNISIGVIRVER